MALTILPAHPTGYELNPERGFWSIVVPEARVNIVTNPSMETDTNGYIGLGGGVKARVSEKSRRGGYSLKYTPTTGAADGVYYPFDGSYTASGTFPPRLAEGQPYSFSSDFFGAPGVEYEFYAEDTIASRRIAQVQFRGRGKWVRLEIRGVAGEAGGSGTEHWLVWRKVDSANTMPMYIDGVQVEAGAYPTTYFDGDQMGIVPRQVAYLWDGGAHNSTSRRLPETSSGGRVVPLEDVGLRVTAYTGFGMPPVENIATPFGFSDGSVYQGTRATARDMVIVGEITGSTFAEVQRKQTDLLRLLAPERNFVRQPIVLRYQAARCQEPIGEVIDFFVAYKGGLEGDVQGLYKAILPIAFTAFDPYGYQDGDRAVSTEALILYVDNDFISQRTADGYWGALVASGFDGPVYALAYDGNGYLWAGGEFSIAILPTGGTTTANNIAYWDGATWVQPDGGVDGPVYALKVGANNVVYAGGSFTNAASVPIVVNNIAAWNWNVGGGTWQSLDQGLDDTVYAIALDGLQRLYAGGVFLNSGAAVPINRIAYWDGLQWLEFVGGANDDVRCMIVGPNGFDLYVGGDFTVIGVGLIPALRIARWDSDNLLWVQLGPQGITPTGADATVFSLLVMPDNSVVAGGVFTNMAGNAINYIAQWNGSVWTPISNGVNGPVYSLCYDARQAMLWVGGDFTVASGLPLLDGFAGYNGSAWVVPDIEIIRSGYGSGTCSVLAILAKPDGTLTIGYNEDQDDSEIPILLTAINESTADVYPIIYLSGTGFIYQILNNSTLDSLFFDDFAIALGERVVIDLRPSQKTIYSSLRGDMQYIIRPGSDLNTWRLQPGINYISMLRLSSTVDVSIVWRNRWHGVEGGVYR